MIMTHKYKCNEDFFSTPTVLNSYWAGLLAADGCIYASRQIVQLSLHEKDVELLKRFKHDLEYDGPISSCNTTNMLCVSLNGRTQLIDDLRFNFNIGPNKTFNMKPPKLDDDMSLAYIVGYIDGDGCILRERERFLRISITGNQYILQWIKSTFDKRWPKNRLGLSKVIPIRGKRSYKYRVSCSRAESIFNCLHAIPLPKLKRKWSI